LNLYPPVQTYTPEKFAHKQQTSLTNLKEICSWPLG
jgi:hypothetical protein